MNEPTSTNHSYDQADSSLEGSWSKAKHLLTFLAIQRKIKTWKEINLISYVYDSDVLTEDSSDYGNTISRSDYKGVAKGHVEKCKIYPYMSIPVFLLLTESQSSVDHSVGVLLKIWSNSIGFVYSIFQPGAASFRPNLWSSSRTGCTCKAVPECRSWLRTQCTQAGAGRTACAWSPVR